jgi:hypothetical protein
MDHSFSIDPRSVLGVGNDASPEEIHRAFLARCKLHHPDHGGDEWAFKMVLRAYEILKETRGIAARQAAPRRPAEPAGPAPGPGVHPEPGPSPLGEFRTLDAELVWIRCEGSPVAAAEPGRSAVAMTLSVCLVISWPRAALVKHSADIPEAAEILRVIIQAFDHLKGLPEAIGSRSRIEDGQFVGWLSYASVEQAEAAYHALHDELDVHNLGIALRTRDEQVPVDWLER